MRISGHRICLWFAAALLASAGDAQRPAQSPAAAALRPPTVNLRLSPDLGDALPAVRAALLGLGPVRIAEPADYEITTRRDYPQSLIAIDARQPIEDWQNNFSTDPARPAPRTFQLGNLVLGDFAPSLRDLVGQVARTNLLLARPDAKKADVISACIIVDTQVAPAPISCHRGAMRPRIDEFDAEEDSLAAMVTNNLAVPRYVALLLIDPSSRITHIPFKTGAGGRPLRLGISVVTEPLKWSASMSDSGNYVLATISSEHPIDISAFASSPEAEERWMRCFISEARSNCARPTASIPPDWSIALFQFHYKAPLRLGIGGGMSVLEGMAPWMVEIYSTVPFTPKEIDDDSKAPEKDRKFLATRSRVELDHRCGGTLIGENLVLTAAHCVANDPFAGAAYPQVLTNRRVRVDSKRLGRGGTTLAIAGVAVPATYVAGRQDNDIALLLLAPDRDTKRFDDVPIRLGEAPISAGTDVTAFGWGYTGSVAAGTNPLFDMAGELQRNPDMLRFGRMRALGASVCRRTLKEKLRSGMVCVVAPGAETGATPDKNVFSCRGDSGGPLVREVDGVEELVGVTSWSLGCGYKDIPSVYTDVTKYRRWIEAATQQLTPGAALRVDEKAAPSRQEGRRQ